MSAMSQERVAIVTDSGCSLRPEFPEVKEANVTVVPLAVEIYDPQRGEYVPHSDLEIPVAEFYREMREGKKLPKTSGIISGEIKEVYRHLSLQTENIVSIHVTSKHSAVWSSAILAERLFHEDYGAITERSANLF